jgi:hypothetical protein
MRIHRSAVATAATVLSMAGGGGVAWACNDPGHSGSYTGTTGTTTTTTTTTTGTSADATTAAAADRKSRRAHSTRRNSRRYARPA